MWREQQGLGTVYSLSEIPRRDGTANVIVLVDLPEGVRIMSGLTSTSSTDVPIGSRVRVVVGSRGDAIVPLVEAVPGDS